ncbi:diguanylate cyclase (GGDEF)-like protein/PAS domain S-box-containing protein [Azospirillum fermentarium]|uniref:two-component system response regulator n=1 Tax=Azospirillum fermentarium TaxID=1233114 RepID=UPI0022262DDB|nr:EAL domain-containing protein [Azospirillum fermentarium]MCW2244426.1 diguanylate cyclase (GGDEF)-like protein/PAS domain S-box-containing protein [Azospirillum fermentarium]
MTARLPPPARQRAVVIDDSASALRQMIRLLEAIEDCTPIGFTDSGQGMGWCRANSFDLLVVDYQMPPPDGLAVIEAIRADPRHALVPVVMVTAADDRDVRYMALQSGATDFLTKPIDGIEFVARMRNLLASCRAHKALAEVSQWLTDEVRKTSLVIRQSPSSVLITDSDGLIEYVNPTFVETTGYQPSEVIGEKPGFLVPNILAPETYEDLRAALTAGRDWRGTFQSHRKDGSLFWESAVVSPIRDAAGTITNYVAITEDITLRKEYEARLEWQANYDSLTGLPNRMLLQDRLSQAIAHAGRDHCQLVVMMVDLDRFKAVNDTLGHEAGDELLRAVAQRLQGEVSVTDTVARTGDDDFAVVMPIVGPLTAPAVTSPETMAERICTALGAPFVIGGTEIFVSARIGIATYPGDGQTPQMLLRSAAAAVPAAGGGAEGGGRGALRHWRFFTQALDSRARQHQAIETGLRHALARQEMALVYHPLVDVRSGRVLGAEALLRWTSAELGPVPPDQFIPMAEATGLIIPIGAWVIETVCRDLAAWRARGIRTGRIAVNVSSRQMIDRSLQDVIGRALHTHAVPPGQLEIEVTERLLLDTSAHTKALLEDLRAMGLRFAIDDFGTGYSAMGYLTQFPFDVLKVDRSFIAKVMHRPQDAALTQAIVAMAHTLDLEVVAEGVETTGQLDFLKDCGCDFAQGFLFSRPLAADDFAGFIRTDRRHPDGC